MGGTSDRRAAYAGAVGSRHRREDDEAELARRIAAAAPHGRGRRGRALPPVRAADTPLRPRHLRERGRGGDLMQEVMLMTMEKLRAGDVREPERLASFVLGTCRQWSSTAVAAACRRERLLEMFAADLSPLADDDVRTRSTTSACALSRAPVGAGTRCAADDVLRGSARRGVGLDSVSPRATCVSSATAHRAAEDVACRRGGGFMTVYPAGFADRCTLVGYWLGELDEPAKRARGAPSRLRTAARSLGARAPGRRHQDATRSGHRTPCSPRRLSGGSPSRLARARVPAAARRQRELHRDAGGRPGGRPPARAARRVQRLDLCSRGPAATTGMWRRCVRSGGGRGGAGVPHGRTPPAAGCDARVQLWRWRAPASEFSGIIRSIIRRTVESAQRCHSPRSIKEAATDGTPRVDRDMMSAARTKQEQ